MHSYNKNVSQENRNQHITLHTTHGGPTVEQLHTLNKQVILFGWRRRMLEVTTNQVVKKGTGNPAFQQDNSVDLPTSPNTFPCVSLKIMIRNFWLYSLFSSTNKLWSCLTRSKYHPSLWKNSESSDSRSTRVTTRVSDETVFARDTNISKIGVEILKYHPQR